MSVRRALLIVVGVSVVASVLLVGRPFAVHVPSTRIEITDPPAPHIEVKPAHKLSCRTALEETSQPDTEFGSECLQTARHRLQLAAVIMAIGLALTMYAIRATRRRSLVDSSR